MEVSRCNWLAGCHSFNAKEPQGRAEIVSPGWNGSIALKDHPLCRSVVCTTVKVRPWLPAPVCSREFLSRILPRILSIVPKAPETCGLWVTYPECLQQLKTVQSIGKPQSLTGVTRSGEPKASRSGEPKARDIAYLVKVADDPSWSLIYNSTPYLTSPWKGRV